MHLVLSVCIIVETVEQVDYSQNLIHLLGCLQALKAVSSDKGSYNCLIHSPVLNLEEGNDGISSLQAEGFRFVH